MLIINHHLSASSTHYDRQHPLYSIYVLDSLFTQPLSKSSLVTTSQSDTLHFILYTSSHKHCLLFAMHVHTITTCFAVLPRLRHLILVSQLFTWNSIFYLNITHPSDHSCHCPLKCHFMFFSYRPGLTAMQHTTSRTTAV